MSCGDSLTAKRRRLLADATPQRESRTYTVQRILGKGSFGVVYQAQVIETGDIVAIKSVRVNVRDYEVQILKELNGHPNIVFLHGAFLSAPASGQGQQGSEGAQLGEQGSVATLNLVLEFLSDTLHRVIKHYNQMSQLMDQYYVALYAYQLMRALAFIHGKGILHCDVKPQNLLLEGRTHALKLCDFGTARRVATSQHGKSYVCSRYYRAPELVLGSVSYTTAVDLWSAGCVFAEMLLGQPLFTGRDGINQLVEIMKVLGTPNAHDLRSMNPNYPVYEFSPKLEPVPWERVFKGLATSEASDFASQLLRFDPASRIPPINALLHIVFNRLREEQRNDHMSLFKFLPEELWWCSHQERETLVPSWAKLDGS
eukprot:TRINITY_DN64524_c0_g1_i1.p1 TRINITY_DN64524_c0_g1~~TRINITY_DN64524_c0_g1_i1.p1  ORF type:complete len:370 (+),score=46.98 TRINITY_DN64524_c0_g1_i1:65-1174(+)